MSGNWQWQGVEGAKLATLFTQFFGVSVFKRRQWQRKRKRECWVEYSQSNYRSVCRRRRHLNTHRPNREEVSVHFFPFFPFLSFLLRSFRRCWLSKVFADVAAVTSAARLETSQLVVVVAATDAVFCPSTKLFRPTTGRQHRSDIVWQTNCHCTHCYKLIMAHTQRATT